MFWDFRSWLWSGFLGSQNRTEPRFRVAPRDPGSARSCDPETGSRSVFLPPAGWRSGLRPRIGIAFIFATPIMVQMNAFKPRDRGNFWGCDPEIGVTFGFANSIGDATPNRVTFRVAFGFVTPIRFRWMLSNPKIWFWNPKLRNYREANPKTGPFFWMHDFKFFGFFFISEINSCLYDTQFVFKHHHWNVRNGWEKLTNHAE